MFQLSVDTFMNDMVIDFSYALTLYDTNDTMMTCFVFQPWVDTFTSEVMIHPVTNRPEHKRSFIPSLWEKQEVCSSVCCSDKHCGIK